MIRKSWIYVTMALCIALFWSVEAVAYSKHLPSRIQTNERVFVFSPRALRWAAYDSSGRMIRSGRASGGAHRCRGKRGPCYTPRGTFRVYRKGSRHCRSGKFPRPRGGAPMPYCMFFKGGYALHGSPDLPNRNASHGCIRVSPAASYWLHRNFIRIGTKVRVLSY